ncbi:hypothetical protein [Phyllobacterium zundukense]|uniref:Uncharacterized protein n=1 Tax=Phyllobacterium zundukense TaxID=1867719 RepID=A0A2N9W463_9HYPH|nr:hypothetical protein [Phyllobacterium zundukense]ATU91999.1 hypothetical protein BLM14_10430 [Phyllobacterium zundukense]PIO46531.1 hypothetical protein B5P45_01650 [Phyllobacterium zundukense]
MEPLRPQPRRHSPKMTDKIAARIKALLAQNVMQHDIAARLEINQGRVSEVKTGKRFPDTPPEQFELGL